jgi:hypothetical protein
MHMAICVPSLVEIAPGVPDLCSNIRVRVRVTLRLTVCQSVRLGVEPTLGLTTRCYFPLEVNIHTHIHFYRYRRYYTIMGTYITIVLSFVTRILSQYCLAGYCHFNNKRQYCHLNILVDITNIHVS